MPAPQVRGVALRLVAAGPGLHRPVLANLWVGWPGPVIRAESRRGLASRRGSGYAPGLMSAAGPLRVVVIMAGGGGTRLWPASTAARPKQLMHLSSAPAAHAAGGGGRAGAAHWRRSSGSSWSRAWPWRRRCRPRCRSCWRNVIAEPRPRSTAPCVALALLHVRQACGAGLERGAGEEGDVTVLPADHHIGDSILHKLLRLGLRARGGARGHRHARGPAAAAEHGLRVHRARAGAAGAARARRSCIRRCASWRSRTRRGRRSSSRRGCYLWNAGIFVMPLGRIAGELERHAPRDVGGRWRRWPGRWPGPRTRGRRRSRPTTRSRPSRSTSR
jgi:hypothetical protein